MRMSNAWLKRRSNAESSMVSAAPDRYRVVAMSAPRLRDPWKFVGRGPVAMQRAAQTNFELGGRHRAIGEALSVENQEVGAAAREPVDDGDQVTLALAGLTRLRNEAGLLNGRGRARPPGLRFPGGMIEARQCVDHHSGRRPASRQLQRAGEVLREQEAVTIRS